MTQIELQFGEHERNGVAVSTEIASIDKKIAELQAQRKKLLDASRAEALKDVRGIIAQYDFTAKELGIEAGGQDRGSEGKTRAKPVPKYANPADKSQTWSGRGVPPKWMKKLTDAGASKEDFLIAKG